MLGILQGGPMLQGQTAADAIAELAKAFPKPTNAQALAVLVGNSFEPPTIDAKTKWAEPWAGGLGVLPRMRLAASGWLKKGDTVRSPDDAAWWSAPFVLGPPVALPLASVWTAIATYAATVEREAKSTAWVLAPDLFAGDSAAIATELVNVADDLAALQSKRADECTPYVVAFKPGAQPIANVPCLTRIGDKAGPLRPVVDFEAKSIEVMKWALVIYLITKLLPD